MIARNKAGLSDEEGRRYIKDIVRLGIGLPESTPNEWDFRAVDSFIEVKTMTKPNRLSRNT